MTVALLVWLYLPLQLLSRPVQTVRVLAAVPSQVLSAVSVPWCPPGKVLLTNCRVSPVACPLGVTLRWTPYVYRSLDITRVLLGSACYPSSALSVWFNRPPKLNAGLLPHWVFTVLLSLCLVLSDVTRYSFSGSHA